MSIDSFEIINSGPISLPNCISARSAVPPVQSAAIFPLLMLPPFLLQEVIAPFLDAPSLISLSCANRVFRRLQPHRDITRQILSTAAKANYFAIFRWAWNWKAPFLIKEKGELYSQGFLDDVGNALFGVFKKHPPCFSFRRTEQDRFCLPFCTLAAKAGDWKLFDWGYKNALPCDRETFIALVQGGQLERLKQVAENPYTWNNQLYPIAAKLGHLEILQWAYAQGCPMPDNLLSCATTFNRFKIIQWLRELPEWERFKRDLEGGGACHFAARNQNWSLLLWLLEQKVAWTEDLRILLSCYPINDLMALNSIGIPVHLLISKATFEEGDFIKVKWGILNGFPLTRELYRLAFASKNPRLIAFLTSRFFYRDQR